MFYECAALGMRQERDTARPSTPNKREVRVPASKPTKVDAKQITTIVAAKARLNEIKEAN